jgi:putative ABC transport system permease protein
LVVFQFTASLFLLIGTMSVYKQIQYMRKQSLGMDISETLVTSAPIIGVDSTFMQKMSSFKEELKRESYIGEVAISTSIPESRLVGMLAA